MKAVKIGIIVLEVAATLGWAVCTVLDLKDRFQKKQPVDTHYTVLNEDTVD